MSTKVQSYTLYGMLYSHKEMAVWICASRALHVQNWTAERRFSSLICRKLMVLMLLISCRGVNSICLYGLLLLRKGWNPNSTWRFAFALSRTRISPTALKSITTYLAFSVGPEKQLLSLTLMVPAFCEWSPFEQDMALPAC